MKMLFLALAMVGVNIGLGIYCLWNYVVYIEEGRTLSAILNAVLFMMNIGVGLYNLHLLVRFIKKAFKDE